MCVSSLQTELKKSVAKYNRKMFDVAVQAQKPWLKKYTKVVKAKKEYHNACKLDRAAATQENTLRGVTDTAPDQACPLSVYIAELCCISQLSSGSLRHAFCVFSMKFCVSEVYWMICTAK